MTSPLIRLILKAKQRKRTPDGRFDFEDPKKKIQMQEMRKTLRGIGARLSQMVEDGLVEDWAICGGIAYNIHGYPRMTEDVDILVQLPKDFHPLNPLAKINEQLTPTGDGYYSLGPGLPVQLLVANADSLHEDAVKHAKSEPSLGIRFVDREHLAALFKRAGRARDIDRLGELKFNREEYERILHKHHIPE